MLRFLRKNFATSRLLRPETFLFRSVRAYVHKLARIPDCHALYPKFPKLQVFCNFSQDLREPLIRLSRLFVQIFRAQNFHAKMQVVSEPGRGATFKVWNGVITMDHLNIGKIVLTSAEYLSELSRVTLYCVRMTVVTGVSSMAFHNFLIHLFMSSSSATVSIVPNWNTIAQKACALVTAKQVFIIKL